MPNLQSTQGMNPGIRKERRHNDAAAPLINVGNVDYSILIVVTVLVLIGIIMVFSSSYYVASTERYSGNTFQFVSRQALAAVLGFAAMIFMSHFRYKALKKTIAVSLFIASNILLVLVQIFGTEINGAKRWFDTPLGSVQPSEIAKVGLILFLSYVISQKKDTLKTWGDHFAAAVIIGVTALLVLWGNLSTAIVVFFIGFGILFIASPYIMRFAVLAASGAAGVALFIMFGDPFRMERVQAWLNPENYATDKGYQTLQSLYAIGSGGMFGLGLGQSRQKLGFIPEAHNDIIFSVICEELGFMGALLVLSLFAVLIWRGIKTAINAVDVFGALVASGIVLMIACQVIINVAVVTNTIPATGVPLPFISYGGTSLAITMFSVGILLNISRYSKET